MSQGAVASGLVRVTVASGTRRVDLVLPGAVPVAELLPELARSVGLLDPTTVHGGYRVVTSTGMRLAPDTGLTLQGVEDGGVLMVTAGVDDETPLVYDDVVEAMGDAVEQHLRPWQPAAGRRTALAAAGLLLVLGIAALYLQHSVIAAGAAALISLVLCVVAIVLSRAQRERDAAIAVAWLGTAYAAVAGVMLATEGGSAFGDPLAYGGVGALTAGLICLTGIGEGRTLAFPPVVVGMIGMLSGVAIEWFDLRPGPLLATALVLVVIAGSVFPWLALSATGMRAEPLHAPSELAARPARIDAQRVAADARIAHEILLAITGTVGLLLVLIVPVVVGLGLAGTLLAVAASVVVMLRTRQYRTGSEVLVGLVSGIAGLAATAVAVLVLHPDWRPVLAVVLAAAGALLLTGTMAPRAPSVRRGRLGDLLESVALIALLPLLVLAVGLVDTVLG